jgi:hypothetical protein
MTKERDCTEGCDGDHSHKWQLEPHPYNSADFDAFVCDDDQEARLAVMAAAEQAWDQCEPGETRTITIRRAAAGEGSGL